MADTYILIYTIGSQSERLFAFDNRSSLHIINILVHATYYLGQIIQHQIKLDSPITPIYAGQLLLKPLQPDLQDFFPGHAPQVSPDTLRLITGSTTTSADTVGLLHLHNPHNTTNSTGGFI